MKVLKLPPAYQIITIRDGFILDKVPDSMFIAALITQVVSKYKNVRSLIEVRIPIYLYRVYDHYFLGFENIVHVSPLMEFLYVNENISRLLNLLSQSEDLSEENFITILTNMRKIESYVINEKISGLIPTLWVNEIKHLLKFAELSTTNDAFLLENKITLKNLSERSEKAKAIFSNNKNLEKKIADLMRALEKHFRTLIRRIDKELEIWEGRYDAEIMETTEEVNRRIKELQVKMQEEIDRIIKWRDYNLWYYKTYFSDTTSEYVRNIKIQAERSIKSINERYMQLIENERRKIIDVKNKKREALAPILKRKETLITAYQQTQNRLTKILATIKEINSSQQNFLLELQDVDEDEVILEIPFYVVFYDNDKIEIIPIMRFNPEAKLKMFSSFVFPFKPFNEFWSAFAKNIEHSLRVQVKLFTELIKNSSKYNMFSSERVREFFDEGFNILVAKKIVKREVYNSIISRFIIKEEKKEVPIKREVKEEKGEVAIVIKDTSNNPIPDALIIIGDRKFSADGLGRCFIKHDAGLYHVRVSAEGYKEKDIEVRIYPHAVTEYKVVLEKISDSEKLSMELPSLIKYVKKYGIKSLSVEKKVKEISKKYNIPEERVWQEIYNYFIKEWINRGKKKEAIEAALLYIAKEARRHGGIMPFVDVVLEVQTFGILASAKEIEKVLQKLIDDDLIAGMQEISGIKMVFFAPMGMSGDYRKIIELAAENNGELTREDIMLKTGWDPEYTEILLNKLEECGIATSGIVTGKKVWWFPALYKRK